jgi:hypothetical protein
MTYPARATTLAGEPIDALFVKRVVKTRSMRTCGARGAAGSSGATRTAGAARTGYRRGSRCTRASMCSFHAAVRSGFRTCWRYQLRGVRRLRLLLFYELVHSCGLLRRILRVLSERSARTGEEQSKRGSGEKFHMHPLGFIAWEEEMRNVELVECSVVRSDMTEPTPTRHKRIPQDIHSHRLELPFTAKAFNTHGTSMSRDRDVAQPF